MADNKLSEAKRQQFDDQYNKNRDKLPVCPACETNNDVIPTVRGKPSADLLLYADEGHVKLSGCTEDYKGWCKKCQQFV